MLIFTGFEPTKVRFERKKKDQKNVLARAGFDLGTFGLQKQCATTELLNQLVKLDKKIYIVFLPS